MRAIWNGPFFPSAQRGSAPGGRITPEQATDIRGPVHPGNAAASGACAVLIAVAVLLPRAVPARDAPAAYPLAYSLACRDVHADLARSARCARREGAMIRVKPAFLARLRFRGGLTEIAVDGVGWLWARRDGLALPVFILDNGPDPFVRGLVRGWHGGKVAFYDRRLRRVLATAYDWSFPFNARGEALVCRGCHSDGRVPSAMVGGRWGLIDRRGRLVMPLAEGGRAFDRFFARS